MKRFDVSVVGELNPDLILDGLPEEIVAERELLASGLTITLGSSSAIFAHNLSALGSRAGFLHQFVSGANLRTCLDFANLAGAFSTTRHGGTEAFCDAGNLGEFLSQHRRAEVTR